MSIKVLVPWVALSGGRELLKGRVCGQTRYKTLVIPELRSWRKRILNYRQAGAIYQDPGAREERRERKDRGEEGEKEGRKEEEVWPGGGIFGYDDHVLKDIKSQSNLTMNYKLHNCPQDSLNF